MSPLSFILCFALLLSPLQAHGIEAPSSETLVIVVTPFFLLLLSLFFDSCPSIHLPRIRLGLLHHEDFSSGRRPSFSPAFFFVYHLPYSFFISRPPFSSSFLMAKKLRRRRRHRRKGVFLKEERTVVEGKKGGREQRREISYPSS